MGASGVKTLTVKDVSLFRTFLLFLFLPNEMTWDGEGERKEEIEDGIRERERERETFTTTRSCAHLTH